MTHVYVYVVHGYGAVRVFSTLKAAEDYRAIYARDCEISRERIRKQAR